VKDKDQFLSYFLPIMLVVVMIIGGWFYAMNYIWCFGASFIAVIILSLFLVRSVRRAAEKDLI
jgi:hypothetical protein